MKSKQLLLSTAGVLVLLVTICGFTMARHGNAEEIGQVKAAANADSLDLSKHKGKVVVLNFWASWSKTSRSENKNLVRVYQKYKSNPRVVFVSVSLDTDQTSWKTAIEEDELAWPEHICDFKKYESPVAVKYKVNTLPKIILIDTKGAVSQSSSKMMDLENLIDGLLK
jgi:thiol-disulfide isomerase/thioredoxin